MIYLDLIALFNIEPKPNGSIESASKREAREMNRPAF
jgi:hypothetical protein